MQTQALIAVILVLSSLLLHGCSETKQIDWYSSNEDIRISPEENQLFVTLRTGTRVKRISDIIQADCSYAIDPLKHKRYLLLESSSFANAWSVEAKSEWKSFTVRLKDPGETDGSWIDGDWELFLCAGQDGEILQHAKFALSTFTYIFLIHGPPN